jgi:hypothetical protein
MIKSKTPVRKKNEVRSEVPIERARVIIQGWFNDFCKFYRKPTAALQISEEGEPDTGAYKITNPSNGNTIKIFKSTLGDYESSRSVGIPGELQGKIWDSFQDL